MADQDTIAEHYSDRAPIQRWNSDWLKPLGVEIGDDTEANAVERARKEFELWANVEELNLTRTASTGGYTYPPARHAWGAWKELTVRAYRVGCNKRVEAKPGPSSKFPEGTTHYKKTARGPMFYRRVEEFLFYWVTNPETSIGRWQTSMHSPEILHQQNFKAVEAS